MDRDVLAFDLDDRTGGVVAHRAGQAEGGGRGVDERPETHALDRTVHTRSKPVSRAHGCGPCSAASPIHAYHAGMPSPFVADVARISNSGLTDRA